MKRRLTLIASFYLLILVCVVLSRIDRTTQLNFVFELLGSCISFLVSDELNSSIFAGLFSLMVASLAALAWLSWKTKSTVSYVAVSAMLMVGAARWSYFEFDSNRWLHSSESDRYPMVNSLISKNILVGRTKEQLIQLLGKPSFESTDGSTIIYKVFGGDRGKYGEQRYCHLFVRLNNNEMSTAVQLRSIHGQEIARLP